MANLVVVTRGLMLYVASQDGKKVTLLVPKTGRKHFGRTVVPHRTVLVTPDCQAFDLERELHLPKEEGMGSVSAPLPAEIVNLTTRTDRKVKSRYVENGFLWRSKAQHRVHIWSATDIAASADAHLVIGDELARVSYDVFWEIPYDRDEIEIKTVQGPKSIRAERILDSDSPVIFFGLFTMPAHHAEHPCDEVSTQKGPCVEAKHFAALYSLFCDPEVEIPRYHPPSTVHPAPDVAAVRKFAGRNFQDVTSSVRQKFRLSDPITCVGGGGDT